jgi:hypothetical protein
MHLHSAAVAITSIVLGLSAVSFAASLALVKPRAQALITTLPTVSSIVKEIEKPLLVESTGTILMIPEVKVKARVTVRRASEPKFIERCRQVELEQGAEEGKTVVYCETIKEEK